MSSIRGSPSNKQKNKLYSFGVVIVNEEAGARLYGWCVREKKVLTLLKTTR
jgi:hypothetical protein